ncbi:MAG: FAD-binding protein [Arsenophonus sp. NC-PE1-MAG3]
MNQFYPTRSYHLQEHNLFLTEALRGKSAYLKRSNRSHFMSDFDKIMKLASRDIIASTIDHKMKRLRVDYMFLDLVINRKIDIKTTFFNFLSEINNIIYKYYQ